jgi:uncharacterized protein
MSATRNLIADLALIGARLEPAGDRPILRAGPTTIPAALVRRVREAKADLLATLRWGDTTSAIKALKYAAGGGEPLARWKLAKIYANGDGVPRDNLKAYDYFSQIAANYDEDNTDRDDRVERLCRAWNLQIERDR